MGVSPQVWGKTPTHAEDNFCVLQEKAEKKKESRVSFLVRVRVTRYLSRLVFFFVLLARVIIFVISVFRPRDVETVATADSALCILF